MQFKIGKKEHRFVEIIQKISFTNIPFQVADIAIFITTQESDELGAVFYRASANLEELLLMNNTVDILVLRV